jgi:hypothetical protein
MENNPVPKILGDFSKISSTYEMLPENEYRVRLDDVEEATSSGGLPQVNFKLVVLEGDKAEQQVTDFLTLKNNDGKVNKVTQSRIKAYAEAILGDEAANNPEGIDTDDLKGGVCIILIKHESYTKKDGTPGTAARITKVLRAD